MALQPAGESKLIWPGRTDRPNYCNNITSNKNGRACALARYFPPLQAHIKISHVWSSKSDTLDNQLLVSIIGHQHLLILQLSSGWRFLICRSKLQLQAHVYETSGSYPLEPSRSLCTDLESIELFMPYCIQYIFVIRYNNNLSTSEMLSGCLLSVFVTCLI